MCNKFYDFQASTLQLCFRPSSLNVPAALQVLKAARHKQVSLADVWLEYLKFIKTKENEKKTKSITGIEARNLGICTVWSCNGNMKRQNEEVHLATKTRSKRLPSLVHPPQSVFSTNINFFAEGHLRRQIVSNYCSDAADKYIDIIRE
jgi:hypothetical protein